MDDDLIVGADEVPELFSFWEFLAIHLHRSG